MTETTKFKPGDRVTSKITKKSGKINWTTGIMAGIDWDDILMSGPRVVPVASLEREISHET